MDEFKDLNELLTVARHINEGKYDLIDITMNPSSELFAIAQYFSDSIKKLKTVGSTVEKSYDSLPAFEAVLTSVIKDSKNASEDVLSFVDKINFNIDEVRETLDQVYEAISAGNHSKALGLMDRLKDVSVAGGDISFDIISSLEFKETSQRKIEKILASMSTLEEQMAHLVIALGLKQNVISPEAVDQLKDSKEILQDQTLVNKLLKEFGL
ncbi:MAG: chemotaxis protein [Deferribacteraceae bacterium]|jgi:chemotaxis protein CheZ|nr:chemotaxis protein [Deferribacteraceae bacterium]